MSVLSPVYKYKVVCSPGDQLAGVQCLYYYQLLTSKSILNPLKLPGLAWLVLCNDKAGPTTDWTEHQSHLSQKPFVVIMPDGFIPGLNWTTSTAALTTPSFNLYKTARNCRYKNKAILNTCRTWLFRSNTSRGRQENIMWTALRHTSLTMGW